MRHGIWHSQSWTLFYTRRTESAARWRFCRNLAGFRALIPPSSGSATRDRRRRRLTPVAVGRQRLNIFFVFNRVNRVSADRTGDLRMQLRPAAPGHWPSFACDWRPGARGPRRLTRAQGVRMAAMSLWGKAEAGGMPCGQEFLALIVFLSLAAGLASARPGDEAASARVRSENFGPYNLKRAGRRSGRPASDLAADAGVTGRGCSLVHDDLDTLRAPPAGYGDRRGRGRHGAALGRVARHRVAGRGTHARGGPAARAVRRRRSCRPESGITSRRPTTA